MRSGKRFYNDNGQLLLPARVLMASLSMRIRRSRTIASLFLAGMLVVSAGCSGKSEPVSSTSSDVVFCEVREEFVIPMKLERFKKTMVSYQKRCGQYAHGNLSHSLEKQKEGRYSLMVTSNSDLMIDAVLFENSDGTLRVRETILDYPFSDCFWNTKTNGWPLGVPENPGDAADDSPEAEDNIS